MPHDLADIFAQTRPGQIRVVNFEDVVMGDAEPLAGEPITLWDAFIENRGATTARFAASSVDPLRDKMVKWLFLTAHEKNSLEGIFWGGRRTLAAEAARISFPPILAGESVRLIAGPTELIDISTIYVDVVTQGDKIRFTGGRDDVLIDMLGMEQNP